MCGIAGATGHHGSWIEHGIRVLEHRGPDRYRTLQRAHIELAHSRLAIIDCSQDADQPMLSDDGRIALVFNGEVYNFQAKRAELERQGVRFRTRSDTEVLLKLYERYGHECLRNIKGMFAFGIWDENKQRLMLARDRAGEKPLYYTHLRDGNLLFASELKAILKHPAISRDIDPKALDDYLTYLYIPGAKTIFRGISKLQPGERLQWCNGAISIDRYWVLPSVNASADVTDEVVANVQARLDESVRSTLVADVPVGVFLSGGLDSSAIVASAAAQTSRLKTFTVTFDGEGSGYDETVPSRLVANHFGTDHHELSVSAKSTDLLPAIVRHFDQPFGNPTALLTYQISRETRKHVIVAIGGDGGDEVFGGYPRYRGILWAEQYRRLPLNWRRTAAYLSGSLPESVSGRHAWRRAKEFLRGGAQSPDDMYVGWVEYFSSDLKGVLYTRALQKHLLGYDPRDYLRSLLNAEPVAFADKAMRADFHSFLPGNVLEYGDKMSMAHGLELRLPFLDADLIESVARLPASKKMTWNESKLILRRALSWRLPAAILARPKVGFNPPMGIWINQQLTSLMDEYLGETQIRRRGYFDPAVIKQLRLLHTRRRRDYSLHLWALLVLEEWHRAYVD